MPSGAATVRYEGVRGVVWRIKYCDADGTQVQETLGREQDGWTRQRAERELGKRLDAVERGHRKPTAITFQEFSERWLSEYLPGKARARSTVIDYTIAIRRHLQPAFGHLPLAKLAHRIDLFDKYVTEKVAGELSPKTVSNHLALLSVMFKTAKRWQLVAVNPIVDVERPKVAPPETETLSDGEAAALIVALRTLEADPPDETEAAWWALTRRMVVTALGTALRRGELLGLTWGGVALAERRISVRQQYTRNEIKETKSRSSRRSVDFGPVVAAALEEQYKASNYRADDCLVFGHPALGTPLDPSKISRTYLRRALGMAGITRPGFQPWHGLRHTALTEAAAAGAPNAYVQARAGHSQFTITERYIHREKVAAPGVVEAVEGSIFAAGGTKSGTK